jgi:mono/diheme cytochrome c family protein
MRKDTLGLLKAEILAADSRRTRRWWSISKGAIPVRVLTRVVRLVALAVLVAASLSSAAAQSAPSAPASAALPDGPGKSIAQRACVACHTLQVVTSKRASPDGWTQVVNEMVNRGADLSDDEIDTLIQYLSTTFGPTGSRSVPSTTPGIAGQPASPGKAGQPSSSTPPASVHLNRNKPGTQ